MHIMISAATHRSGSTLLQRIFNTRKKTLIWGEQDGLLTYFHQMYRNLRHYSEDLKQQRLDYFNHDEDPNHWIACMAPEIDYVEQAVIESIKVMFDCLYDQYRESHDFIGFKEVRYGEEELTLFRKCYPDTPIILLVRHPLDVWRSMLGAGLGDNVKVLIHNWNAHAGYYVQLSKQDPNSLLVKYEDIVNQDPRTIERISSLGQLSIDEIHSVLSKKIWSTRREASHGAEIEIMNRCGEIMKLYGYL